MSTKLEADNRTIQMVWPVHVKLSKLLEETDADIINEIDNIKILTLSMKKLGRDYMKKNEQDFLPQFEHKVMTFLEPTMKKLVNVNQIERDALLSQIDIFIQNEYGSHDSIGENSQTIDNNQSVLSDKNNTSLSFLDEFVSYDNENVQKESEIQKYFNHTISNRVNAAIFWVENSTKYPNLFKLYKNFSCIPASSASSERDFSTAGNIITDKRIVILPKNVNDLIVAKNCI